MAIKGSDWAKMSLEEIAKHFHPQNCPICKYPLVRYEKYRLGDKIVCIDCYYDAIDKEVSRHPIGIPRICKGIEYSPK
jgi:hypothetical protein